MDMFRNKKFAGNAVESEQFREVYTGCNDEKNADFTSNSVSNTRYTALTFLPKNLFEQFSYHFNRYFLIVAILQLDSNITPVDPITTWGPLFFILTLAAVKEYNDDRKRAADDKRFNSAPVQIIDRETGEVRHASSADIRVGDLVQVDGNQEIPCDLAILASSDTSGQVYMQTTNLDGETDFKLRTVPTTLRDLESVHKFRGRIECPLPDNKLYQFDSTLEEIGDDGTSVKNSSPLSHMNCLLQACVVRNVSWCVGVAVYTGMETKIGQCKYPASMKISKISKTTNSIAIGLFVVQLLIATAFGISGSIVKEDVARSEYWYLLYQSAQVESAWVKLYIPLRFLLLCSYMIPISLKVTMDITKFGFAQLIQWDEKIYDAEEDVAAVTYNSGISEDLSQVEYICSDKTGTLTQNIMEFRRCSISGRVYGGDDDDIASPKCSLGKDLAAGKEDVVRFAWALNVCHSILPEAPSDGGEIIFKASSPDEAALVLATRSLGYELRSVTNGHINIRDQGTDVAYELLHTLDFTPERRRMSVIVRAKESGKVFLVSKGADDTMAARCLPSALLNETIAQIEDFSSDGLRCLVVASREIPEAEYAEWNAQYKAASLSMVEREVKTHAVYELIEVKMNVIGSTAIEDKLQEGVAPTLEAIRNAGIRIIMCTGDRASTAVQIAVSCNMVPPAYHKDPSTCYIFEGTTEMEIREEMEALIQKFARNDGSRYTVVITGSKLEFALNAFSEHLAVILAHAGAVICCRVTPIQKALVVRSLKDSGKLVLSVGDGGNDVSMIREANVGVGIAGREGLQAARASDYSIGKFRYILRLLFVHGHYSHHRSRFIALFSFYKSILIVMVQLFFNVYTAFSGASLMHSWSLTMYNTMFTGLPPFFYLMDKDTDDHVLETCPNIYAYHQSGRTMDKWAVIKWISMAICQGIFLFALFVFGNDTVWPSGISSDALSLGFIGIMCVIVVIFATFMFEVNNFSFWTHIVTWGNCAAAFLGLFVFSVAMSADFREDIPPIYSEPRTWLTVILGLVSCMMIPISFKWYKFQYTPTPVDASRWLLNEAKRLGVSFDSFAPPVEKTFVAEETKPLISDDEDHTKVLNSVKSGEGPPPRPGMMERRESKSMMSVGYYVPDENQRLETESGAA